MLQRATRIALMAASRIVPDSLREQWLRKWVDGLPHYFLWLADRGLARDEVRQRAIVYARDGWAEAALLRWPDGELVARAQRASRTPWAALALSLVVLIAGTVWSRGFALMRASFAPMPAGLVTAQPARSYFGKRPGFTSRQFFRVVERAQSYRAIGGYSVQRVRLGSGLRQIAFATPETFALLGVPVDADQTMEVFGRRFAVATWPRDLRIGLARPDHWVSMQAEEIEQRGFDMNLVAALQPGVATEAATAELRDILLTVPARRGTGNPTDVVPLAPGLAPLFGVLRMGLVTIQLSLALWAAVCVWRNRREWKKQLFLLAVTAPMMTGLLGFAGVWAGIPSSGSSAGAFWVLWCSATIAALVIWRALRDQRLRCPECLTRMTKAVQIGTHANPLLEGVGDEMLCEHGHGALFVPAVQAQAFGPAVWRGSVED